MTKFVQCAECNMKITGDKCEFAIYTHVIDGKECVFCCEKCAEKYQKKKRT